MSGGGAGLDEGLYAPAMNHRTYAHLLECAESCLKGGTETSWTRHSSNGASPCFGFGRAPGVVLIILV